MKVSAAALRLQCESILQCWGMSAEHARITADRLEHADLRGIDSHGVATLFIYAPLRDKGYINFQPKIRVVRENAVTALIDADAGLGHVPATDAMNLAVGKCRAAGMAAVAVRNSNHYGAAGAYSIMAAEQGLIGLSFTSGWDGAIVPTFGAEARFGTNPIAFAAPARNGRIFYFDIATSTVAIGKLRLAELAGKPLESGWALDDDGVITTDPKIALATRKLTPLGATRTLGSHKGYGLAATVEILSTMLSGACYWATRESYHPDEKGLNIGHFFIAIDPTSFREPGEFEADLENMVESLHQTRPSDPGQPVLVPGDPEREAMADRLANGIPLTDTLVSRLRKLAADCGAAWTLT